MVRHPGRAVAAVAEVKTIVQPDSIGNEVGGRLGVGGA
jgi:hypothetical protein